MGNPKIHYGVNNLLAGLIAACKSPTDRLTTSRTEVTCLMCRTMIRNHTV